ncbi:MAG: S9 family peptidase [Bacteroidales bacterium]|nr:S9 family peptidase [Bacteroidales bacterium]
MKKSVVTLMATTALLTACAPQKEPEQTAEYIGKTSMSPDHMTPELLMELGQISNLQASPDGKRLLYGVTYTSVAQNKSNSEICTLNINSWTSDPVTITHTNTSEKAAVWLDSDNIAFISNEGGKKQLWRMKADGSERTQISHTDRDIEGFLFNPDRSRVLLVMTIPVKHQLDSTLFEGLDKASGMLFDELSYRHWDRFVTDIPHPYLADVMADGTLADSTLTDILEGEPYECPMRPFGGIESFAWSPDGKRIVYSCRKETGTEYAFSTRSSLYLYDIASRKTTDLHPGDHGYDTNPAFSSDGQWLAFLSMARNGYESDKNRLCLLDMTANDPSLIDLTEKYDNSVDKFVWEPDNKGITFIGYSYGIAPIFHIDLNGNVRQMIEGTPHDYASICYCGDRLFALRHDWHSPNEVFAINNGQAVQITHENEELLTRLGDMGEIESRRIKCTNGDEMLVWIAYPANFNVKKAVAKGQKVPTLLYCQGGPESAVSQFWSTRWNIALMQADGYAVVLPNRHGVPGFGQKFQEQIAGDFAGQCMKDYLTAIDAVAKEPWCDSDRLGAIGASFGGYSIYWLAGHHEKRFKTFIAHCGIFNNESMYGETEEMWFADWDYGGAYFGQDGLKPGLCHTPKRGKGINASYIDSPHKSITKWDTPILVIHGEKDYRVPVTQGMQAFNLARMRGIPARFLYFPDECHWVNQPQNAVLWHRVFNDWLDTYLKK